MDARNGRIILAAILVLGLATAADAQYDATVRGLVRDASGRPTPGAVVTISHPTMPVVRVAVTDLGGQYVIHGLEPGAAYVVHVTHPNFRKQKLEARAYATVQDPTTVHLKARRTTIAARY
jgi:protocatechuate 3,4-dioxygenase beta subunit